MEFAKLDRAIDLLEEVNSSLEPELLDSQAAKQALVRYAKAEKLVAYGVASLSRKVHDAGEIAKATGTPMGKAKVIAGTGEVLGKSDDLNEALRHGEISLDQAATIASAEASVPGAAGELLKVAQEQSFQALRDKARKTKLEAEQHRGLAERQRASRSGRNYSDELGMVHLHLALEPHVGTPIVARAETEAGRLFRKAKQIAKDNGSQPEPFERYLADAYAAMLSGSAVKPHATRPELVVLVSHEVATRGWSDVRADEVCKIPGVGPISPQTAKDIAQDAFLNGVFFDGVDLRHFKRWSKQVSKEVLIALELGDPPDFDGIRCVDCGNHFRPELDHVKPRAARGESSHPNSKYRCHACHEAKTARDREAGLLKPRDGPQSKARRGRKSGREKSAAA